MIYESIPVCHYLDETFGGRKLVPSQPKGKAIEAMLLAHFDVVSLNTKICTFLCVLSYSSFIGHPTILQVFQD